MGKYFHIDTLATMAYYTFTGISQLYALIFDSKNCPSGLLFLNLYIQNHIHIYRKAVKILGAIKHTL